jgi:hypothetical protein
MPGSRSADLAGRTRLNATFEGVERPLPLTVVGPERRRLLDGGRLRQLTFLEADDP